MHYSPRSLSVSKQSPGHPYLNLADLVTKVRRERRISRGKLARMIGYGNLTRGAHRINEFERGEGFDPELLTRMVAALGIPQAICDMAFLRDWSALYCRWNKWIDEPIPQQVIVALGDTRQRKITLSRRIPILRFAERFASRVARQHRLSVWMVFSRRLASHWDRQGRLTHRIEALPPCLGEPFVAHGGLTIFGWTPYPRITVRRLQRRFAMTNRYGVTVYSNK